MAKASIIDCHNHPNWLGHTFDRIVADMDRRGIAQTWLLAWDTSEEEFNVTPHYHGCMDPRGLCAPLWLVVEGLQKYPTRFIGGWAPDPRNRHSRARLASAVALHGIKVYGEMKFRMRYDCPDSIAMFRYCAELGLPVLFHLEAPEYRLRQECKGPYEWPEWHGGDISVVDNMCRLCPDTMFIGHGPGFWREISGGARRSALTYPDGPVRPGSRLLKLFRRHSNLHGDLSGGSGRNALARDLEHARRFVNEFKDRLLFGRDCFDGQLLATLDELKLDRRARTAILHENARRLIAPAGRKS